MAIPRIWVDFMKTDAKKRLLLTTIGSREDLEGQRVELTEGLPIVVYSDDADDLGRREDLVADGRVTWDHEHARWVVEIDWAGIRHESGNS